jgi:hypothetical protein
MRIGELAAAVGVTTRAVRHYHRDLLPTDMTGRHSSFLRAFFADFAPAQAEAIRRALRILDEGRP